jgi:hypothetical protein
MIEGSAAVYLVMKKRRQLFQRIKGNFRAVLFSNVVAETWLSGLRRYPRIRNEDFADSIRKANRYWLSLPKTASVVIEFGQSKDVSCDLVDIRVAVLDVYPHRDGDFPPVIRAKAGFESCPE